MKNEKLIEISQLVGQLDVSLEKVESKTYKNAARTKLLVIEQKLRALQKSLEKKIENER
jgi:hypothetical protein